MGTTDFAKHLSDYLSKYLQGEQPQAAIRF